MDGARASGILLHPTSLPSRWGIGDLGDGAYEFADFLAAAGQRIWQVMPLGPTGYGDSPYQSFSAFAGNPLLISFDILLEDELLEPSDLADAPRLPDTVVDYGAVIPFKQRVLRRAFARFRNGFADHLRDDFEAFCEAQTAWLDDYALFAALKHAHNGAAWYTWKAALRSRTPQALAAAQREHADEIAYQRFIQYLFFDQWKALKNYVNDLNISILGDIPIFVAYDSADVWANPDLFYLDRQGKPTVVAGVPPDYFSATGQLWGNPLYRWDVLKQRGYDWWINRFRATLTMFDIVRLDHFRGFAACWEVPASEETAMNGRWVEGPGAALFEAVDRALGGLPIVAEDLGVITPDVEELRDRFGFPGMRVLQFAFGVKADQPYLPHNHIRRCIVYTGTHDNDTTLGWWRSAPEKERRHVQLYLGRSGEDIAWDFIRAALSSVADTAIIPLQDVLALGSEARMNTPGQPGGNWTWRFGLHQLTPSTIGRLRELTILYGRYVEPEPVEEGATGKHSSD
ncbi:MAG: 4-alpha-glucanotransferase [Chloroflexi bacterium]|nr:4-alpha-glucanotransferase [Chloroflexota bacterium]